MRAGEPGQAVNPPGAGLDPDLPVTADVFRSILVALVVPIPLPWAQVCVDGLEKFTQSQLSRLFLHVLLHANTLCSPLPLPAIVPEWDSDEDLVLLSYLNSDGGFELTDIIRDFGAVFRPTRTLDSIAKRFKHLARLSEADQDAIIQSFSRKTVLEERFHDAVMRTPPIPRDGRPTSAQVEQCVCLEAVRCPISRSADAEIESLFDVIDLMAAEQFGPHDLAMLQADTVQFFVKQQFVIIGRATVDKPVDINLGFIVDPVCPHVSRQQASLQLMWDGHFYIENIGQGVFRVNGIVIKPNHFCAVLKGALLDFCGIILLFIPNQKAVDRVMAVFEERMRGDADQDDQTT
jgi:hypothetical protein